MEFHVKTAPTAENYCKNGREFSEAAWRCFGGREGKIIENGVIRWLPAATVVNAAFSCEMNLKAFLIMEEKTIPKNREGHNLKKLFEMLEKDTQTRVSRFCMPKASSSFYNDFLNILETHANDFASARYFVEHDGWQEMSPITVLTIAENLSIITNAMILQKKEQENRE